MLELPELRARYAASPIFCSESIVVFVRVYSIIV